MCDIVKPKNFNPSSVTFSDVKPNKFGGKTVYVNYNDGKFAIQTPIMNLPYNLNVDEIKDSKTDAVTGQKYSTNLSFRGMDREHDTSLGPKERRNAKRLREFHEMLRSLEERIVEEGVKQSGSWLQQKDASPAVVRALFNSSLKVSKDANGAPNGKWPDTIKGKVMFWDGVFTTEVYNKDDEEVDVQENLQKGAQIACLLESGGLWFANGKFGISWRISQCKVDKAPRLEKSGYRMLPESDDDEDDEEAVISLGTPAEVSEVPRQPASWGQNYTGSAGSEGSSSEVDQPSGGVDVDAGVESSSEEEEEEEPPPPPKKLKKSKKTKK